jgi:Flp pilus assembly protein TadB
VSRARAERRAEREREAAIRAAARAAEAERRERRAARARTLRRISTDRLPGLRPVGRDTGALARRRRVQRGLLTAVLLALNVLLWVVRPDWEARLAAAVVSVLAFPVLALLLLPSRR